MTAGVAGGGPAVLLVCDGNICRSPAAELLWRARIGSSVPVSSAGLVARVGEPVAEPMARLLVARGVTPDGFAARQLTPESVAAADLVLTMTTAQRGAVVSRAPVAVRRTFTLREFADLVGFVDAAQLAGMRSPATRLAALVEAAPRARARRGVMADDIEDPYRRSDDVAQRVLLLVADAVDDIAAALAGNVVPDARDRAAGLLLPSGEAVSD